MCPNRLILLLKFATAIAVVQIAVIPASTPTMTDQTDTADVPSRSLNFTKDGYGISPIDILSRINLNNRKVAATYYEDVRTAMIRRLQMVDGLYDLAVDFGAKSI